MSFLIPNDVLICLESAQNVELSPLAWNPYNHDEHLQPISSPWRPQNDVHENRNYVDVRQFMQCIPCFTVLLPGVTCNNLEPTSQKA